VLRSKYRERAIEFFPEWLIAGTFLARSNHDMISFLQVSASLLLSRKQSFYRTPCPPLRYSIPSYAATGQVCA